MKVLLALCLVLAMAVSPAKAVDPTPYGRLPAIEYMRLSPSGDRFAFVGMLNDKRMIVAVQDGKAIFAGAIGDLKVRNIVWASENHLLVQTTKTENLMTEFGAVMELETVFRVNLKDKTMARIFEGVPSVAQRIFGFYGTSNVDGKVSGYFGGITLTPATGNRAAYVMGSGQVDLYRIDLDNGQAHIAVRNVANERSNWLVTPNGKIAGTSVYDDQKGIWHLHEGSGRNKPLMQKTTPLHDIALIGLGRTSGTLLVVDNSGERDMALEVKTSDGSTEELFTNTSVSEFLSDPDTGLLIGAMLPHQPGATFFDPVLEGRWKSLVKTFPG